MMRTVRRSEPAPLFLFWKQDKDPRRRGDVCASVLSAVHRQISCTYHYWAELVAGR